MTENSRRAWLARMAAGGAALALGMAGLRRALAAEAVAQGVSRVRGDVLIGGRPATRGMAVRPGDVITTGRGAELVFVAGRDAFMARSGSRIEISGAATQAVIGGLRLVTGALLSVFESGRPRRIRTATATIGIRGTAVYLEAEESRTYICTCYGEAEIASNSDPAAREIVRTTHHEQPRYVMGSGAPQMLMGAPVVNHTDAELTLLEDLVGRKPPFLEMPSYRPGRY